MTRYLDGARSVLHIGLIASLLLVCATALQAQDKATVFGQMQNLAQQILTLKASASDPAVAAQVEDLRQSVHGPQRPNRWSGSVRFAQRLRAVTRWCRESRRPPKSSTACSRHRHGYHHQLRQQHTDGYP